MNSLVLHHRDWMQVMRGLRDEFRLYLDTTPARNDATSRYLFRCIRPTLFNPAKGEVSVTVASRSGDLVEIKAEGQAIEKIVILGPPLTAIAGAEGTINLPPGLQRIARAVGEDAVRSSLMLDVGVVGLGKLGGPVFGLLVGQVHRFVGIDRDQFGEENAIFVPGGIPPEYLGKPKVQYFHDWADRVGQQGRFIQGDALEPKCARELVTCDVVIDCTDSPLSKLYLAQLCATYSIVFIWAGVEIQNQNGRPTVLRGSANALIPGEPGCPFCRRTVSLQQAAMELMDGEERAIAQQLGFGAPEPRASLTLSTIVAAQVKRLLETLIAGQPQYIRRIAVDLNNEHGQVFFDQLRRLGHCPICEQNVGSGDTIGVPVWK